MNESGMTLSLAGRWRFALDEGNEGIQEEWFARELADAVRLPGTTDENEKGEHVDERCDDRLSRVWRWIGPAWYQRDVTIPPTWQGKQIALFLERTKHSRVWVDRTWIGTEDSLSAPHRYDLSEVLTPGDHRLTILIDNAKLPPVGPCHAVDERTQTNWNGIIGRIELEARDPVWVEDLQVFPEVDRRQILLQITIANRTARQGPCRLTVTARCADAPGLRVEPVSLVQPLSLSKEPIGRRGRHPSRGSIEEIRPHQGGSAAPRTAAAGYSTVSLSGPLTFCTLTLDVPEGTPPWDEFQPARICITANLRCTFDGESFEDERSLLTGLRSFRTRGGQFVVNGRATFLRGRHDACIFPLTGYPPMDKEGWLRVFRIGRSYGLNHHRFHSWCPPEAAFEAADEVGVYLQVELPNKAAITAPENKPYELPANAFETRDEVDPEADAAVEDTAGYLRREGEKILKAFGNHPSFVMITLGNEIGGDRPVMKALCDHFRAGDGRHLYAQGSNHFHWEPGLQDGDEFWVTGKTASDRPTRGSSFQGSFPGHIENEPPSTTVDYRRSIAGVPVPVVGHEVGQYQVSPDYSEIPRYSGVLRARNLEIFRARLEAAGMLDQADDFVRASGALSAICYREDIESALRTPGFGGFQLLDLQDFPGQGTALVGMLNAFLDSKGLIAPEHWREFCCETVPLLRMGKYTWTADETFAGRLCVAHYGQADLMDAVLEWTMEGCDGTVLAEGRLPPCKLRQGEVTEAGPCAFSLSSVKVPQKLMVTVSIAGTPYRNAYPIWVYPHTIDTDPPEGVTVVRELDGAAQRILEDGGRVLLLPELDRLQHAVKGSFQCDFWCWPMFRRAALRAGVEVAPGTLGILCDPAHAALQPFPTEFHGNWQWWHLLKNARPMILDETAPDYRPIVQVIDNFARNHKLGLLFEGCVGAGKLLVCGIDLLNQQDKPEARQFLAGLLAYMRTDAFTPTHELALPLLAELLTEAPDNDL